MASSQIPPSEPSPGIGLYAEPDFILLFWLRFWLRFGHGLVHGSQYISIVTDRTVKWPNHLYSQRNVSVYHSYSLSVSSTLGRSTDLGVGGSSPSGRTTDSPGCTFSTSEPPPWLWFWSRFQRDFLDSPRPEGILGEECHM